MRTKKKKVECYNCGKKKRPYITFVNVAVVNPDRCVKAPNGRGHTLTQHCPNCAEDEMVLEPLCKTCAKEDAGEFATAAYEANAGWRKGSKKRARESVRQARIQAREQRLADKKTIRCEKRRRIQEIRDQLAREDFDDE